MVEGNEDFFVNDMAEQTGRNLFVKQQFVKNGIKVVSIKKEKWKELKTIDERKQFLALILDDHNISVKGKFESKDETMTDDKIEEISDSNEQVLHEGN